MAVAVPATVRLLLTEITTDVVSDPVIESYSDDIVGPRVKSALASVWGAPHADPPAIVVLVYNLLVAATIVNARIVADDDPSGWAAGKMLEAQAIIDGLISGTYAIDPDAETTEDSVAPLIAVSDRTEAYASDTWFVGTDETEWLTSTSEERDE